MKIAFRADASQQIGTGHVMRYPIRAQIHRVGGYSAHAINYPQRPTSSAGKHGNA